MSYSANPAALVNVTKNPLNSLAEILPHPRRFWKRVMGYTHLFPSLCAMMP